MQEENNNKKNAGKKPINIYKVLFTFVFAALILVSVFFYMSENRFTEEKKSWGDLKAESNMERASFLKSEKYKQKLIISALEKEVNALKTDKKKLENENISIKSKKVDNLVLILSNKEEECRLLRESSPKIEGKETYVKDGKVYYKEGAKEIVIAENSGSEEDPTNNKKYLKSSLSRDGNYIVMDFHVWELSGVEVYDIKTKNTHKLEQSGVTHCWLEDNSLMLVVLSGMSGEMGIYKSTNSLEPWNVEKEDQICISG